MYFSFVTTTFPLYTASRMLNLCALKNPVISYKICNHFRDKNAHRCPKYNSLSCGSVLFMSRAQFNPITRVRSSKCTVDLKLRILTLLLRWYVQHGKAKRMAALVCIVIVHNELVLVSLLRVVSPIWTPSPVGSAQNLSELVDWTSSLRMLCRKNALSVSNNSYGKSSTYQRPGRIQYFTRV